MENSQKKVLMALFFIIIIIAIFINNSLLDPFIRYVLQYPMGQRHFYNLVFYIWMFVFTIALWFPLVNGIGARKATFVCLPCLLMVLLLFLTTSSVSLFLLSGIISGIGISGTLYLTSFLLIKNENRNKITNCGLAIIPCAIIIMIFLQISYYIPVISIFNFKAEVLNPAQILTVRLSMMILPIIAMIILIIIALIEKD